MAPVTERGEVVFAEPKRMGDDMHQKGTPKIGSKAKTRRLGANENCFKDIREKLKSGCRIEYPSVKTSGLQEFKTERVGDQTELVQLHPARKQRVIRARSKMSWVGGAFRMAQAVEAKKDRQNSKRKKKKKKNNTSSMFGGGKAWAGIRKCSTSWGGIKNRDLLCFHMENGQSRGQSNSIA